MSTVLRGILAFGCSVVAFCSASLLVSCSPAKQELDGFGGSSGLGRYSPSLVQKNGQFKACFDRAGMTARDLELLPRLQSRLFQALVERTEGVVNPFPARSKVLPWCDGGDGFNISIYLFGNFINGEGPTFAGLNVDRCSRIETTSVAKNNNSLIPGRDALPADDRLQSCAMVFTRVVYASKGESKEGAELRILKILLHELLHSYGFEHEMGHPGMSAAAKERGAAMQNCLAEPKVSGQSGSSQGRAGTEDFAKADPDSVMNYCSPYFRDPRSQARLSDGDVRLLFKLYGNGKEPSQSGAPPAKAATWESQTQSVAECSQFRANDVDFSKGWKTSYVLVEKNGAWEVTVTAASRSDGRTEDWKTHPVGDAMQAAGKFATYIDQGRRILQHRTPQGSVLTIEMACQ
jgi:hypothetical protein